MSKTKKKLTDEEVHLLTSLRELTEEDRELVTQLMNRILTLSLELKGRKDWMQGVGVFGSGEV